VTTPAPSTPTYQGDSIVDFLASTGQDSSFGARSNLAKQYGISNYRGSAEQNTQLLNTLRGQARPSSPESTASTGDPVANDANVAEMLGKLGVSFGDYQEISSSVSARERKEIADEFGISDLEASVFAKPEKSTEELFKSAYKTAGLADLKEQINKINDEINTEREQLREATGAIDENPFLTETSRVGRGKRVLAQAQESIGNKLSQVQQLTDLYNTGIGEIEATLARSSADFEANRALDTAKLNYMLKQVENQVSELGAGKANEGLASYLAGRTLGEAPDVVGSASTGYFQYDRTTGKYVPLSGGSGSGSGGGSDDGTTPSVVASMTYEQFVQSEEAQKLIAEEQERLQMTMAPALREEFLRKKYDEMVANAPVQEVSLKNLTATNKRDLQQSGLINASGNTQSFFLSSDNSFRNLIKQGVALGEIPQGLTLAELKEYYDAWQETEGESKSSSSRTP